MQQAEGLSKGHTGEGTDVAGVTAVVKASVEDGNAQPSTKVKKAGDSMYHERQGCGLFWAVGRCRPTNYMIVSHNIQPQASNIAS